MDEEKNFFSINKMLDYQRGVTVNADFREDRLTVGRQAGGRAVYISDAFDSGDYDTVWHRMVLDGHVPSGAGIRVSLFAANQPQIRLNDGSICDLRRLGRVSLEKERLVELMAGLWKEEYHNPRDVLLHTYKGRYLWLKVEIFGSPGDYPEIERIKIYFPAHTFVRYLPEIYQTPDPIESFLGRFVGIFQSIYLDMEEQIERVTSHLEPETTQPEILEWLAEWLKIEDSYLWQEFKLRKLLTKSVALYQYRGTRGNIEDMVGLYCGKAPYIIEYQHTKPYRRDRERSELLSSLYGDNPYTFTVLLEEDQVKTEKDYIAVRKIIDNCKPAYAEARLIVLRPCMCLDQHTYLGINSEFTDHAVLTLQENTALTMVRIV